MISKVTFITEVEHIQIDLIKMRTKTISFEEQCSSFFFVMLSDREFWMSKVLKRDYSSSFKLILSRMKKKLYRKQQTMTQLLENSTKTRVGVIRMKDTLVSN